MTSALVSSTPNSSTSSIASSASSSSIPKIKLTFKANSTAKDPISSDSTSNSKALSLQPPAKSKRQLGAPRRPYHRRGTATAVAVQIAPTTTKKRKRNLQSQSEGSSFPNGNAAAGAGADSTMQSQQDSDHLRTSNANTQQHDNTPVYLQKYSPKWTWTLCEVEVKTALEGAFKSKVWKRTPVATAM